MISARVDGQALSDEEILANGVLFLAAGHETTVGLIGYGTQALLDHREETAKFPDAGTLRLARGARRHLAFGGGVHHCLGSTVARAEARAAFRALSAFRPIIISGV